MSLLKKSVTARIPIELYDKCNQHYENMTDAVIAGLELLCNTDCKTDCNQCNTDCNTDVITINTLQNQINNLEDRLSKAPDPVELAEVRAHFEGLQRLTEEKDKRIIDLTREVEGLQKEVERLDMFAHYFKSIEVKQIEAPAAEIKKPWYKFW
jgi:predicted  nucleic acid-binding Zn-ribbon protein